MRFLPLLFLLGTAVVVKAADAQEAAKSLGLPELPSSFDLRYGSVLPMPYFEERGEGLEDETKALLVAVAEYRDREDQGDRAKHVPLRRFLKEHPASTYRLWIEGSIAEDLYRSGRFSASLDAWEEAWTRVRDQYENEPKKRAYVGRVGVELGSLYARLGEKQALEELLSELDGFPLVGPMTERRQRIREGYSQMVLHPERSFNCGPYALARVLRYGGGEKGIADSVRRTVGDGDGFSLKELDHVIAEHKLDWQVGKLEEAEGLVFPCVVHWRADHYAAALREESGRVLIEDPTFKIRKWIPVEDFLEESSGYFLIPGRELPDGWSPVSISKRTEIIGKGAPEGQDDNDDPCPKGCPPDPGMPSYGYDDFFIGVVIRDTPLKLESPFGPGMEFSLAYRENSRMREDPNMPFTTFGSKWSCNFLSFVSEDLSDSSKFRLYLADGRQETHLVDTGTTFERNRMSQSQLEAIVGGYKRTAPDGSELVFGRLSDDGDRHYLTEISDPQGNSLVIAYIDGPGGVGDRIDYVADDFGRKLLFKYEEPNGFLVSKVVEEVDGTELREVNLGYDSEELASVVDAAGIVSYFEYESVLDLSAVTTMTTPYGSSSFEKYSFTRPYDGNLDDYLYYSALTITDPEGLKESILFAPLVSPSAFPALDPGSDAFGSDSFGVLADDEYPYSDAPYDDHFARVDLMEEAVTLTWDKKVSKYSPPDFDTGDNFENASLSVWLLGWDDDLGSYKAAPYLDATKAPDTGWVVYDYPNDFPGSELPEDATDFLPSAVGQVVENENGTLVQAVTEFEYTSNGQLSAVVDPAGRRSAVKYHANGIDPTEEWVGPAVSSNPGTYQMSEMVYGMSGLHLPTEVFDEANGKTIINYNSKGQVITVTNALNEVYEFNYGWPTGFVDPSAENDGFLESVTVTASGINAVEILSLTYHEDTGFIHTFTDSLTGLVTIYDSYDPLGRVTKVTHPDGSSEEFLFEEGGVKYLHMVRHLNREGKNTHYKYNGNQQLVSVIDPELRNTRIKWCSCGQIASLTDALGRRTQWKRDLLGRPTSKILPDGSEISYTYEPRSGRLATVTNPNEQGGANASVELKYYLDGALATKSYPGDSDPFFAQFTYESLLGRMSTAKWHDEDGVQRTTSYGYYPLRSSLGGSGTTLGTGMLRNVNGPWSNDTVLRTYDALGRQVGTQITNDASPWGSPTYSNLITSIDGLGRIKQHVNNLSTFTTSYTGNDSRADYVTNGSFKTSFGYLADNLGGYLDEIHATYNTTTISKFDYTYTVDGKIETWTKQQGSVKFMDLVYDLAGQLKKATTRQTNASGAVLQTLGFGYDRAGNRTSRIEDGDPFTASFNERNQLTTGDYLGTVPFIGEMNEYAEVDVTADGLTKQARVWQHGSKWIFETEVQLESDGTTQVDVDATDISDNTTSESYRIDSDSGEWADLQYDFNGNTTSREVNGVTTTYTWDRENRLETVTVGGVTERFVYNAMGERVKIIRNPGGSEVERRFIWAGGFQPIQERNSSNVVVGNFFDEGEQRQNGALFVKYYYARDHLGSVREMVSGNGNLVARYDYSPYGVREAIGTPSIEPTFGFTGHFHHELTGYALTFFRAYDPGLGRWLSQDPLESVTGEMAEMLPEGPNLYGYVGNDPINYLDDLGGQRSRGFGRFLPLSRAGREALNKGGVGAHGRALANAMRCARNTNQALKDLGKGAFRRPGDKNTSKLVNLNKTGGMAAAQKQFDALAKATGNPVRTHVTPKGTIQSVDLPNGGTCSLRPFSTSKPSRPTIQLDGKPGSPTVKFRFE